MKREIFYKVVIAVLIILNLLQVGAHFMEGGLPRDTKKKVVSHLNLDKAQEKQFFELAKVHRDRMIELQKKQEGLVEAYFNQPSDALLNDVTILEREKIKIIKEHFSDIKKILRNEQYQSFEEFKKNTLKKILSLNPKNRPQ